MGVNMPDAEKALEGKLADGVSADEVLDALKRGGFKVVPSDEPAGAGDGEGEPQEVKPVGEEEAALASVGDVPIAEEGEPAPMGGREGFLRGVARKAMQKNGYPLDEEEMMSGGML